LKNECAGIITDKELLPITSLHFGRTTSERSSGAHTLGKFVCTGGKVNANQGPRKFNQMPKSCEEINLLGHTLNGLYSILVNSSVETVYCDFTRQVGEQGESFRLFKRVHLSISLFLTSQNFRCRLLRRVTATLIIYKRN
jgi:hypothetical protein